MERASHLLALTMLFAAVGPADAHAAPGVSIRALSPADQTVARALFEAQVPAPVAPLTLEQIAARKRGKGWSDVFTALKAQGLVRFRTLAGLVSDYNERHRADLAAGAVGRVK